MNNQPPNAPNLRRFSLEERYESLIIKPPSPDKCCDDENCKKNCNNYENPPPAPNLKNKKQRDSVDNNEFVKECIIF